MLTFFTKHYNIVHNYLNKILKHKSKMRRQGKFL